MSPKSSLRVLLSGVFLVNTAFGGTVAHVTRDGSIPSLTHDPNTTSYCTWWVDLTSPQSCTSLLSDNLITLDTFRRWNPSITANCDNLTVGHSYCVEAAFEPITTSTTTTTRSTSTTTSRPSTTTPGNGVSTPTPVQVGMVSNCNKFHLVVDQQTCLDIATRYSISVAQFIQWNPAAKTDCTGLWSSTYACVGIIGGTTTTSRTTTTTTTTGNGIATPTPSQPGMVNNCDSFYFVVSGDTCSSIASKTGISVEQLTTWNPTVGSTCLGLWMNAYICISVIGHTPTLTVDIYMDVWGLGRHEGLKTEALVCYNLGNGWNDQITSLRVPSGFSRCIFFRNGLCFPNDEQLTVPGGTYIDSLGPPYNFNDMISSYRCFH